MLRYKEEADPKKVRKYLSKRREASVFVLKTLKELPNERKGRWEPPKRPSIVLSSVNKVHTLDLDLSE